MSFVSKPIMDTGMDEEKPVVVLQLSEIDNDLILLSSNVVGQPHGENKDGNNLSSRPGVVGVNTSDDEKVNTCDVERVNAIVIDEENSSVVDEVNTTNSVDEQKTVVLEVANDSTEHEAASLTFGDSLNNDSKHNETVSEGVNVENSSIEANVISSGNSSNSYKNLVHSLKSLDHEQDTVELELDVKPIRKRGRPKKERTGPGTSRTRESIEADTWETVEPVSDPANGVRRSGRKRRQKRISYIDLLEENPIGGSNKREKIVDDEWNYEGEVESLNVDEEKSPPPSPPSVRKSMSKRKVAVRRREKKSPVTDDGRNLVDDIKEEEVEQHQCENCSQVFQSQIRLENHLLICNEEIASYCNQIIETRFPGGTKPKQSCPICQKCFAKRNGVKRHLALKHTNLVHISCALCSKKIGDIEDNYRHFQKEHKNSFPDRIKTSATGHQHCPVCGDTITKFGHMKQHLVNAHSNLIHVTCALCQRPVGTMLEYFQHFIRYHSHSSITRDKNKEVVTTDLEMAVNTNANKASSDMSSSEKSDLICLQCNKSIENDKLFALHVLSHKVDENTDIVGQNSKTQTSVTKSTTEQNSCLTSATDSNEQRDSLNPTTKPLDEYPLPVWWLPPETVSNMTSASALLGPDLLMAINRSLNTMTEMSTKLNSELDWKDTDYLSTKEDLVRRLNKLLQFSSGITDIGKCLLLVLEECLQFNGNPFGDNDDIRDKYNFDEQEVEDEDLISVDDDEGVADNENETINDNPDDDNEDNAGEESNISANLENNESLELTLTSNPGDKSKEKEILEKECLVTGTSSSTRVPVVRIQKLAQITPGCSDDLENQSEKKSELEDSASKNTSNMKNKTDESQDTKRRSSQRLKDKDSSSGLTKPKRGKKKFICKICGKQLKKKSSLTHHMLVHSEARPFQCKICNATFKAEDHLKRHCLVHLKDERFKCDFCSFSHRTLSLVQKHSTEEHPNADFFSCDLCKHKSRTTHDLAIHKRIHEPKKCKLCDYEARHLSELKAHERKSHANKFCTHCSFSCVSKYQLRRHLKTHIKTEMEKSFCCELCGATFNTSRKLEYHVVRHSNKTPLACTQCDYKCSSRQSYDAHMLKHSGIRPYKCTLCDAAFYRTSYLKQHMLMHSDEKGFCCRYCGKGFKYRYNCQEHEMIHTGEKKFKCKFCDFACRRRKILDLHVEEHKARGSDVEYVSEDESGAAAVAEISSLMLKTENLVPIL